MPDEQRHGCCLSCTDWTEIEQRVLGWMSDNSIDRQRELAQRERTVNALMTPTGRRRL